MSKKNIWVFILAILFVLLQTSFFPYMRILNGTPNILLVFVCIMSYYRGSREGLFYGLAGGFVLDIVIGRGLGLYALIYMAAGFIIGLFPIKNIKDNIVIAFVVTMGLTFPTEIVIYWLGKIITFFNMGMSGVSFETGKVLVNRILPGMLYNSIIFVPVYFIGRKINRFLDKDKKFMSG